VTIDEILRPTGMLDAESESHWLSCTYTPTVRYASITESLSNTNTQSPSLYTEHADPSKVTNSRREQHPLAMIGSSATTQKKLCSSSP
jgi:hypothetical protein